MPFELLLLEASSRAACTRDERRTRERALKAHALLLELMTMFRQLRHAQLRGKVKEGRPCAPFAVCAPTPSTCTKRAAVHFQTSKKLLVLSCHTCRHYAAWDSLLQTLVSSPRPALPRTQQQQPIVRLGPAPPPSTTPDTVANPDCKRDASVQAPLLWRPRGGALRAHSLQRAAMATATSSSSAPNGLPCI